MPTLTFPTEPWEQHRQRALEKFANVLDQIASCADWVHVDVAPFEASDGKTSWDVVVRIDGHYANRHDAEAVAEFLRTPSTTNESETAS
ncbi:hypothetical protein [Rhodococcus sp. KRD197]|uniref:hypothetical protein n=1 Tax=Rhodococcus sp. KRD197 TaxID=2729731 RepID=UPI0019D304AC|nr:hypothetical protein [Rhodococcus sp. KRD197]